MIAVLFSNRMDHLLLNTLMNDLPQDEKNISKLGNAMFFDVDTVKDLESEDAFAYCYVLDLYKGSKKIGVKVGFTTQYIGKRVEQIFSDVAHANLGFHKVVLRQLIPFENKHDAYAFECILHRYYDSKINAEQYKSDYFLGVEYEKEDCGKLLKLKENYLNIY